MNLVWSVETCGLLIFVSVNILESPLLSDVICDLGDNNILAFYVFTTLHFKNSIILDVLEIMVDPLELLEPVSVGFPELHVT